MPYLHFFPEEFLALQRELKNHPEILEKISEARDNAEAFAIIGAELGILLDGIYEPKDLAAMLTRKLQERGTLLVRAVEELIPVRAVENADSITLELANAPDQQKPKLEW